MRRFFTITGLCALLALVLMYAERNATVRPQAVTAPASDVASAVAKGDKPLAGVADPSRKAPASVAQPSQPVATPAPAAVQADAVAVTPAHIPSSAPANEVEQELAKLSQFDLKATVQKELARLGCYGAKIDGRWGGKSQAAVKSFNERSGASWGGKPTPKLAKALRSAPDGLCRMECKPGTQSAGCAVTAALPAKRGAGQTATGVIATTSASVPSSTIAEKLASADPHAVATLPTEPKRAKKQAAAKQKSRKRFALLRDVERRERRPAKAWAPRDWPRATQ